MSGNKTKIHVFPEQFFSKERDLLSFCEMKVSGFIYPSGVQALRIKNKRGEIVMLPFLGQQVWDAVFDGRSLKMHTPIKEPKQTLDFLSNMGSFLFHCGASAMGSPGPEDKHPIHGELVNAPYSTAYIDLGEDVIGNFIGVGGEYEHSAAFGYHYLAQPYIRLYENATVIEGSMRFVNLNKAPMEYMYLAHINFLPVDNGRFAYSAIYDSKHVRVRADFPDFMKPNEKLQSFLDELTDQPEKHHTLNPNLIFDPEVVFYIDYATDGDGKAHSMHIHPNGTADYVSHRPAQLDHGIRWICRTPDLEALGMEAGTAGVEGFGAEKKKGNIKVLNPGKEFYCTFTAGLLPKESAEKMETKIDKMMGR